MLLRVRGNLGLVVRTLFVTCHSSHERDRRSTQLTGVCLEPEVPLQVCSRLVPGSVTAVSHESPAVACPLSQCGAH